MVRLLGSLFGGRPAPAASPTPATADPQGEPPSFEQYLAVAIRHSRALTPRGEAVMTEHIRQFAQIACEGADRRDDARRNARHAAENALDIRAAELLRIPLSPRRTLTSFAAELYRDAMLRKARHDAVVQMRLFCSEMTLNVLDTGAECDWCKANDGKAFPVSEDPNELLARHCSCAPYSSATFYPAEVHCG
ncbi:hypothetical protein QTH91_15285 [Variovorax dokdonensis]|uniref:Uncharacterized protein n=1 Tax=Variovorax dokdonensis TaxID=344883 RepID=A0ABT7NDC0_9BURK|nr:hypothetical protein [Variovorax dokdonensis]MDM0045850.1 hypothetical protein [Variovorax dokdonensis]